MRGAIVRTQELILRKNAGFQEQPDQPRHPLVGHASAYPVHQMVVVDVVEAALNVTLDDPVIRHALPPTVAPHFAGNCASTDVLQGAMRAPAGSKPVRDVPELRLEDRLQEHFDRALYHAVFDRRNSQGPELPRFTGFGDKFAP